MLGLELRVDYQQSNFPLVGVLETRLPNGINGSVCAPKYEAIQNKHFCFRNSANGVRVASKQAQAGHVECSKYL